MSYRLETGKSAGESLRLVAASEAGTAVEELLALIDTRRRMLEAKARPLGRRLFAEKPARFVRRIETLWDVAADEAETGAPERLVISS